MRRTIDNLRQMCALADEQGIAIVDAGELKQALDELERRLGLFSQPVDGAGRVGAARP